ncbi:unnamed protein product [Mytilus coruscus]|uniref:Uncharacterized protein n=1 Tax=Mytilus coruscus TaxID=42192 RepID=A0A6J8EVB5_MYTCO|nr:unnamed protein product [Mytilus coruscus]
MLMILLLHWVNKESINETLDIFEMYGKASGSKTNMSKSEIMCIGKAEINVLEIQQIGLKYSKDCIQVLDKCYVEPDAHQYWLESFNVQYVPFKFSWTSVHCYWKSPDCLQLDFKIVHNRIFTNLKLKRIGLSNSDICDSCNSVVEDLFHIFLNCHDLDVFHNYVFEFLRELLEKCKIDILVNQGYRQMFLSGITSNYIDVNTYFVNFVLSVERLCIFKRRQMIKNDVKNIDLIRFFKYTLKHYISYYHVYCKITKKMNIFERNFLKNNSKMIEMDGVLIFNF